MKQILRVAAVTIGALVMSNSFADGHGHHAKSDIDTVLAAQSDEHKARYSARNPKETLEFFEVKAGDTVMEANPGGGWYTKILLPLLGEDGKLISASYSPETFASSANTTPESTARRVAWPTTWPNTVAEWGIEHGASVSAANFGSIPEEVNGTVDKVLFFRAMHGFARFEDKGGFLTSALEDSFNALKPGGILGVVQHAAREDRSDEWASGDSGYLKQSYVVAMATKAGFELVDSSDINANELDQAKDGDIVWRLSPSLSTTKDDPEAAAKMAAIGESNRMTLKFKKPV